MLFKLNIPEA